KNSSLNPTPFFLKYKYAGGILFYVFLLFHLLQIGFDAMNSKKAVFYFLLLLLNLFLCFQFYTVFKKFDGNEWWKLIFATIGFLLIFSTSMFFTLKLIRKKTD